jgi:hypothetical protein
VESVSNGLRRLANRQVSHVSPPDQPNGRSEGHGGVGSEHGEAGP